MNRAEQGEALKDLDELIATIADPGFADDVRHVIMRARFTTGQRQHKSGELAEMEGSPGPYSSDPTGEDACWSEMADATGKTVSAMCQSLSKWLEMAKWIRNLSSTDVVERAKKTVPDCLACGEPVQGRVHSGFDRSCYDRWDRSGRPDRLRFINQVKNERVVKEDPS